MKPDSTTLGDLLDLLVDSFVTMQERCYTHAGRNDYSHYMRIVREIRALGAEPYVDQSLTKFDPFGQAHLRVGYGGLR